MSSVPRNISTLAQLAAITNLPSDQSARDALQEVIDRFPLRVSAHLLPLVRRSEHVARQFLPDVREVTSITGQTHCFTGLLHTGIHGVERMYPDRCIIMPQPTCPAYCRFCFRKFYEHTDGRAMSQAEMDRALIYVEGESLLREVLITGGEPLIDKRRLAYLLAGLRRIDHIGPIRVACRSLITDPALVDDEVVSLLRSHQDLRRGRPIEVALHCNHADEISADTIDRLAALRESGIHVYNQAVLLRGINADDDAMLVLLRALRSHGVETYNLFFAGPVQGMDHMRPTLDEALRLKASIRRQASGRLNPHLIVTTRLGKVELGVDGWIVEREQTSRHVWLRTPYTLETFRRVDTDFSLPEDARIDEHGYIVMRYLDGTPAADTGSGHPEE